MVRVLRNPSQHLPTSFMPRLLSKGWPRRHDNHVMALTRKCAACPYDACRNRYAMAECRIAHGPCYAWGSALHSLPGGTRSRGGRRRYG